VRAVAYESVIDRSRIRDARRIAITSLRDVVLADLRRAKRLIERLGDEIAPQFRIASPEGDYWIALTLPPDTAERAHRLQLVSDFMVLKSSSGFVLSTEIKEPDAIITIGITRVECLGNRSPMGCVRYVAASFIACCRGERSERVATHRKRGSGPQHAFSPANCRRAYR
jgi:hypothetical protein